jgi:hypothetical protein
LYGNSIDLFCINERGQLMTVDLKRRKTPREAPAQAPGYASWVQGFSASNLNHFSPSYFHPGLDQAFKKRFKVAPPDDINRSPALLTVASEIEASAERPTHYPSEACGTDINALRLSYVKTESFGGLRARVFLLSPFGFELTASARSG